MPESSSRKILVVDDQPMLAKAIKRMLSAYDVTLAGDAREALAKIQAGERYDAILSDLMMPYMTGMDLYTAITAIDPGQVKRMIFMTGGAFTAEAREFFERVSCPTLEKPFDRAALVALLEPLFS